MAAKQTFLLVSLSDSKAKKLAEVIQNNTCRKILGHLSNKSCTESELSKDLGIPLPTAHYNLKHLVEAKLVKDDEYHYSTKGKEVTHYSLAKQFVIIAPQGSKESIKEKLKTLMATFTIIGAVTVAIKLVTSNLSRTTQEAPTLMMKSTAPVAGAASPMMESVADTAVEGARMLAAAPVTQPEQVLTAVQSVSASTLPTWAWFLLGAISALSVFFAANFIIKKIREKRR
ncbi:helix-turn-helix transcriptional regulator [Candidatus Woesearchaeota archaeon]|nr:helix-turn-helix transcriptional regulator [Candidatus Woesearchaeota archaeon]